MNIYCAGAIRGDSRFQSYYCEIVNYLASLGHNSFSEMNCDFRSSILLSDDEIFKRDIWWLENSEMLIAEVSGPSLGVGFEIAYALYKKKIPVLAVYNNVVGTISGMIKGCSSNLFTVKSYSNLEELKEIVYSFISKEK